MDDSPHSNRHNRGSKLRRMQTELPSSGVRSHGDHRPGSGFWETVLDNESGRHSAHATNPSSLSPGSMDPAHPHRHHRQSFHSGVGTGPGTLTSDSNQKIFDCQICGTSFSQKSHLTQHLRTVHEKLRPHKCQQCPMAFAKRYDLNSHVDAVHSKERPHRCEECNKQFAKRSNLTRHMGYVHSKKSEKKSKSWLPLVPF